MRDLVPSEKVDVQAGANSLGFVMVPQWIWLLISVPILVLTLILRSAWFKGKLGEFKVNVGVTRLLNRKIYRLVKNVTFPVGGETTQIDHLVVSPYGIFVIETKNMNGWIFGDPDQSQWTQVIFRFKQRFQNPILQNNMHVKVVRKILGLGPHQVHNVVAFVGASTFKTQMPAEVVHGVFNLADFIRSKHVPVFDEDEIHRLIERILDKRLNPGLLTNIAHVRSVKRKTSNRLVDVGKACPRCGGDMIQRANKRSGERFLGCKLYPRCKGVRSLR